MINWIYFPKSSKIPNFFYDKVVQVFINNEMKIDSNQNYYKSNEVLELLRFDFESNGFVVEKSKKAEDKIKVPVLFGENGKLEKYFDADAYLESHQIVLEVEAGRGVTNYQFLKDLFQASVMHDVEYLAIAVRNDYRGNSDYETVKTFFDALYSSERLKLPLKGIVIIGY